ncbi:MAG: ATP-binding protein [Thermostichus sp. DG02_5_bins_236]
MPPPQPSDAMPNRVEADLQKQVEFLQQQLAEERKERMQLLAQVEAYWQQIQKLTQEKRDLEILLETTTEHADTVEAVLFQKTEELVLAKSDLELILQTITEHGDTVEADLRASEARFRSIFENAPEGMCQISPQGRYLSANQALARIFGYGSPAELLADLKQGMEHFYVDPEHYRTFLQGLQAEGQISQFEAQVQRLDGRLAWISQSAQAVHNREGELLYYEGTIKDITERKRMDQMKKEFVSTVNHELRTPLTAIRGALGLIIGGAAGELPGQVKSLAEIAYRSVERLVALVNDILDIEKIEAGRMEFNMQPQQVLKLVHQAIEDNRTYATQYDVELKLDPSSEEHWVMGDSHRLLQVLTNLLSNACKFSPPGSEVYVRVAHQAGHVQVAIRDQGTGIPEEFKGRIFQKFAQADSSTTRMRGGTGLGLSICKAIIEQHGGKIGFDSAVDVGTTFYFILPEYQPDISTES